MSKLVDKSIQVFVDENGHPTSFIWRRRRFRINSIRECWKYTGCWWAGEPEKTFYRVEADGSHYFELCREALSRNWKLYKIFD